MPSRGENSRSHSGEAVASATARVACHAALREHEQPRAIREREVDVVGHADAGGAAVRFFPEHLEALQLMIDVEKRGRLVEQEQLRLLGQTCRQEHPLPFTPAECGYRATRERCAPAALHRVTDDAAVLVRLAPANRMRIASHEHKLFDRERHVRTHRLRQVADDARQLGRRPGRQRPAVERDGAFARPPHARQQIQQRALSRAVAAHERDELACSDVEPYPLEDARTAGAPSGVHDAERQIIRTRSHAATAPWFQRLRRLSDPAPRTRRSRPHARVPSGRRSGTAASTVPP